MVHDTTIKVKGIPHKIENAFVRVQENIQKKSFFKDFHLSMLGTVGLEPTRD